MINGNPMTDAFTRAACAKLPEKLQNLLTAVDRFAYDAAFPIETVHGEYAGDHFNKDVLVHLVKISIRSPLDDSHAPFAHRALVHAFHESGLPPAKLGHIVTIVEEEALKRIESGLYTRESDGAVRYREHGHHGRQYIARNSTHRAVTEVFPANDIAARVSHAMDQGLKFLGLR